LPKRSARQVPPEFLACDPTPGGQSQCRATVQPATGWLGGYNVDATVPPFMKKMAFWPVEPLRHRMSALPSPLKSPTPTIFQLRSVTVWMLPLLTMVAPFMNQTAFCPVLLLRHRMSAFPSPSRSPTPTIAQCVSDTVEVSAALLRVPPFMNQIWL